MPVVMTHVFRQDDFEMAAPEDEEPVQAFPADGADEPLGDGIRPSRQLPVMSTIRPEPSKRVLDGLAAHLPSTRGDRKL